MDEAIERQMSCDVFVPIYACQLSSFIVSISFACSTVESDVQQSDVL